MTSRHDSDGGGAPSSGRVSEAVEVSETVGAEVADEGGDPACYAHLVCPECGAVTTEGHRPGCSRTERGAAD
jgi:hypothetical protein